MKLNLSKKLAGGLLLALALFATIGFSKPVKAAAVEGYIMIDDENEKGVYDEYSKVYYAYNAYFYSSWDIPQESEFVKFYKGMSYDSKTHTLTLNNVKGEGINLFCDIETTVTIKLVGKNTLRHIQGMRAGITFTGNGSLTITDNSSVKYGGGGGGSQFGIHMSQVENRMLTIDKSVTLTVNKPVKTDYANGCIGIDGSSSNSFDKIMKWSGTASATISKKVSSNPQIIIDEQGKEKKVTEYSVHLSNKTLTFKPGASKSIKSASVKLTKNTKSYKYTGKAIKPEVTVKLGSKTLKKDRDYTISYKNNKNVGNATISVIGIGDYKDTANTKPTFKITKGTAVINVKTPANQKAADLAKEAKVIKLNATTNAGKLSYKVTSVPKGMKKNKVTVKNGSVTLPKGAKAGKYVIEITAAKTKNVSKKATKKVTITVK